MLRHVTNSFVAIFVSILLVGYLPVRDAQAALEDGYAAYGRGDHETAFLEFLALAEQGDPAAQYSLAYMYYQGEGVPQDPAKAVEWYRQSAMQGIAEAELALGLLYSEGTGVARDQSEGTRWIRRAAERGLPTAQFELGVAYAFGLAVPRDYDEAQNWYARAANSGEPHIQLRLGMMYYEGYDSYGVSQDDGRAALWIRQAAEQGLAPAEFMFGTLLEEGRGVPRDLANAIEWYRRAAAKGVAEAQGSLGELHFQDKSNPQYCTEAVKWLRQAADQNLSYAQYLLAKMYVTGECLPNDLVQTYVWYSNAWHSSCNGDQRVVIALRYELEMRMSESAVREANAIWRAWAPTGAPALQDYGIVKDIHSFPRVTLPRPYCMWTNQFH